MSDVRTIRVDDKTWTVEDRGDTPPDTVGRGYRTLTFRSGNRILIGRIATQKLLAELSQETLELVLILSADASP